MTDITREECIAFIDEGISIAVPEDKEALEKLYAIRSYLQPAPTAERVEMANSLRSLAIYLKEDGGELGSGPMDILNEAAAMLEAPDNGVMERLAQALKQLSFLSQTTGGTEGRDDELVSSISVAQEALAAYAAHKKGKPS